VLVPIEVVHQYRIMEIGQGGVFISPCQAKMMWKIAVCVHVFTFAGKVCAQFVAMDLSFVSQVSACISNFLFGRFVGVCRPVKTACSATIYFELGCTLRVSCTIGASFTKETKKKKNDSFCCFFLGLFGYDRPLRE